MTASGMPNCSVCDKPLDGDVLFPTDGGAVHVGCRRDRHETSGNAGKVALECGLCGLPAAVGDHLIYDGAALVHADCQVHSGAGETVGALLRAEAGRPFCHSCLAARLGLKSETVRKTVWALRATPMYRVLPGTCTQCGAPRVVVQAAAPPNASEPKPTGPK